MNDPFSTNRMIALRVPLLLAMVTAVILGLASLRPVLAAGQENNEASAEQTTPQKTAVFTHTAKTAPTAISPIFTPEVQAWSADITRWAAQFNLNPNHVALIMQIESCGWAQAVSGAGAQGLFQVMPFHFADGENMLDPDTNARRGLAYFAEGIAQFGDPALAFAGYNGGHGTAVSPPATWPEETKRYHQWASGILRDLDAGLTQSPTIQAWLAAGGDALCQKAAASLHRP